MAFPAKVLAPPKLDCNEISAENRYKTLPGSRKTLSEHMRRVTFKERCSCETGSKILLMRRIPVTRTLASLETRCGISLLCSVGHRIVDRIIPH